MVHNGRAGDRVAIKDEESIKNKKKRGKSMGKKKGNILDRMFAAFVNDEDTTPEDIKEAAEAMKDDDGNSSGTTEPKTQQTGDEEVSAEEIKQAVSDALAPLIKRIEALETAKATDDGDDLEKLESELTDDDDSVAEEGTVEVDPNKINDDDDETSKTEEKKEGTVDKAIALQVLRAMKPMIAAMPDDQKKKATDGLRKALLGLTVDDTAKGKSDKAYQDLLKRKAQDAAIVKKNADFGIACRARNPHRKDGK